MIARVFTLLYHACWYVVAAIVLFTAVSVTLIRLMLPHINDYREEVQVWVGKYLEYPVEIRSMDAEWQGWRPTLYLNEITIYNTARTDTIANLMSVNISFDPVFSFYHWDISPLKLTVTGPDLSVIRRQDGSINIARGESVPVENALENNKTEFAEWLSRQQRVSIQGAKVRIIDYLGQTEPLSLTEVSLDIKNSVARIQVDGSANLPAEYGESFKFAFDFFGYVTTPDWSGQFYLEGSSIYPAPWLSHNSIYMSGASMSSAPANLKIWGTWKNTNVEKIEGLFDVSDVQFFSENSSHTIQHIASSFSIIRQKNNDLNLKMEIQDLKTSNGIWPVTTFSLFRQNSGETGVHRYTGHINYLKLEDLIPLAGIMPGLSDHIPAMDTAGLRGTLTDIVFVYDPGLPPSQQLAIDTDFQRLEIQKEQANPVISGVSGHLQGNTGQGVIKLNSTSVDLNLPSMFDNLFTFYELYGDMRWKHDGAGWTIDTDYIEAHTLHFNSRFRGKLIFNPVNGLPYLDLMLNISDANIENVSHYLPNAISEQARQWVNSSLVSGKLSTVDMILRGDLEDFPYDNKLGRFGIMANVHNTTLDYHPEWPPVDGIEAEIIVNGNSLTVNANNGIILDANIREVQGVISDLGAGKPLLKINGHADGHTKDAIFVIKNSPLAAKEALAEVSNHKINGSISLDLELSIPLSGGSTGVDGVVAFHDAAYVSPLTGIRLNNITGNISFTENSIASDQLHANYHNNPVEVGLKSTEGRLDELNLKGSSDNHFILEELRYFFPGLADFSSILENRINGSCKWMATLSRADPSATSPRLIITSSLSGLSLGLPAPFGKTFEPIPVEISTTLKEDENRMIEFFYGSILKGYIEFDQTPQKNVLQASLHFGENAKPGATNNKIMVTGRINNLSFSEWIDFFKQAGAGANNRAFDRIKFDVNVSSLGFLNQIFNDARIQLDKTVSGWEIDVHASEITGSIILPEDMSSAPMDASFSKIIIKEEISSHTEENYDPNNFPPLKIHADEFSYKGINLGELELVTSRTNNGMSIDSVSFIKPDMTITGSGTWKLQGDTDSSAFKIDLQATHLDAMLQTFNYSVSPIKDGETTLSLNAAWPGSPMDFSLANMNGNLDMIIDKGQFIDIKPNAGRLFGLLSIQTLSRRLSLDFSDLFSEGLSFDHILGNFSIEEGNAYTNNLSMDGPSANIDVTGRTGLIDHDYDQIVTVTPQVANSLPVASALFGPIGVGVGAVIFLAGEIFESLPKQIDKLLRYQYTIKGSWEDPVVEQYKGVPESSG